MEVEEASLTGVSSVSKQDGFAFGPPVKGFLVSKLPQTDLLGGSEGHKPY
jgi:hypothetical protein